MLKIVLLVLLLWGSDAELAKHNAQAIASARAAVGEMIRLARTPEEKALAEKDRLLVERAAELLSQRTAARKRAGAGTVVNGAGAAPPDTRLNPQAAAKQMQEAEMSFNLQYLQLQSQMQHENRSYTAISNVMKSKHDTVKNSISNIR